MAHVSAKAELENVCIDSTVVRAHACAQGATASNATAEALARSRGGFGCKIHALTDALSLPVRFMLTGGQASDTTQAIPRMMDIGCTGALLADKGYDANARSVMSSNACSANSNTFAGLAPASKRKLTISRKCWPSLRFCCGCADTSTEPNIFAPQRQIS